MVYDLVLENGDVYLGGQLVPVDVYIDGGTIAALGRRGEREHAQVREAIDITGRIVVPGAIDTHTHTREPGYTHKEDFFTASQAAAAGGYTTIFDMPNVEPPTDSVELFEEKRELAASKSIVDWGHWVAGTKPERIRQLADAGATGFKIFQVSGAYPHDPRLAVNDEGALLASFRAIAETGLPCLVHPFNQSLFERFHHEALERGEKPDGVLFSEIYTREEIWHTAVNTLLALQSISNVRLQLLHTHSAGSLELIRRAKERGQRVTCEVDPKYYHYTLSELHDLGPRIIPGGFVTQDPDRVEAIYRALEDGTIDNIGSDHAPHTSEELEVANTDAWQAHLGSAQLEWVYGVVLTDVANGRHSLRRAVELLSEGPARLAGVWPQKGLIAPGMDADLNVIDLDEEYTVTEDRVYSKVGITGYLGRKFKGRVKMTFRRGELIARDGEVLGRAGTGKYIGGTPQ